MLMFSFKSFIVLSFTIRAWIHFELIFVCCEVGVQCHSFAYGYPVVPARFVEKTIVCPLNCLRILVENQLTINMRTYV